LEKQLIPSPVPEAHWDRRDERLDSLRTLWWATSMNLALTALNDILGKLYVE
jgi:hypothetical protein